MTNQSLVIIGVLFLLYAKGNVSLTQLLLLLAILSTSDSSNCPCNCTNNAQ